MFAFLFLDLAAAGERALSLDTGATYLTRTDWMLSPNALSGTIPRLGLHYEALGESWMQVASAAGSKGAYRSQPDLSYTVDGELDAQEPSNEDIVRGQAWVPAVAWIGRNPYPLHNDEHIWNTRSNTVPLTVVRHVADG